MQALFTYNKIIFLAAILLFLSPDLHAQDAKIVFEDTAITGYDDEIKEEQPIDPFLPKGDIIPVKQRQVSPLKVKRMKEDEDFWYTEKLSEEEKKRRQQQQAIIDEQENGQKGKKNSNDPAIREESVRDEDEYRQSGTSTLVWVLIIIAFVGALVLYLGNSNVSLFSRRNRPIHDLKQPEEEITEDIFAINYQKDIDRAAAQGNYRLAIRLMFLRVLKNLSERNIIRYKQDKTNLDYLMEVQPTAHYRDFFKVTRNYEYSWYGQFAINEEAYRIIRNEFDQFDKSIR